MKKLINPDVTEVLEVIAETTKTEETEETNDTNEPEDTVDSSYTEADKSKARAMGQSVADDLVGYTNDKEKQEVQNIINNNLNENNIIDFINGYKNNKGLGSNIMKQIGTEYGWTDKEKGEAQKNILENVMKQAISEGVVSGPTTGYTYLMNQVNEGKAMDATFADQLINQLLEQIEKKHAGGTYGGGSGGGSGAGSNF